MISFRNIHFLQGFMELPYVKCEGNQGYIYRPCLPVTFSYGSKAFPVGSALVDTGADMTILPLDIAHFLEVDLDDSKTLIMNAAGGGVFKVTPSQKKITYTVSRAGYRSISWKGIVYFADNEPIVLLGHYQCLDQFDLLFQGPEKTLGITPRFRI